MMRTHVKILAVFFLVLAMCFSASKGDAGYLDPYTYEDIDTFDSTWLYNGVAYWSHAVPADFDVLSAEITLEIRVNNYSEVGALDLLCSNTNNFGFWDPYSASSNPGYIARLYWDVPPIFVDPNLHTVTYDFKANQLPWIDDDGNIYMALIGSQYIFPTGFPARFYLTSSTLTASAVPIPGAVWLLGSGVVGLAAARKRFLN